MDESKLTKEQIQKIQAKIDIAVKSSFSTKTKEELLVHIKKKLNI
ncbi:hypothetical protein IWX83_001238 [Flavobacterium sp. CG_9.1]|nr:hypothetical protein [Flavobacterium sp. CG_9.1]MBG6061455.1 hypothetical protein [Flavobacterium sp. CG_9.1]